MKFTINTDILSKENLTLGEFLILLMGYHNVDYESCYQKLVEAKIVEPNLFKNIDVVLSNNSKDLVAKILMESDEKAVNSGIDFLRLAVKLQELYPTGNKPGTTYSWQGTINQIAQKLRTLVVKYDFTFTEKEALDATREYVNSFKDYKYMAILRNFLLTVKKDSAGHREINSMFMTIIEDNRENENYN